LPLKCSLVFFSKNLIASKPFECLKDAKATEVIKNKKKFYTLKGKHLNFKTFYSSVRFKIPSANTKSPLFIFVSGAGRFQDNMSFSKIDRVENYK
jgi:hypothetical protein